MPKNRDGSYQDDSKLLVARVYRSNPTPAEAAFWQLVRRDAIPGCVFRRQFVIDAYTVDFYCHRGWLVVEIDGGVHDEPDQHEFDVNRDEYLHSRGYRILRFRNEDVFERPDWVLEQVRAFVAPR